MKDSSWSRPLVGATVCAVIATILYILYLVGLQRRGVLDDGGLPGELAGLAIVGYIMTLGAAAGVGALLGYLVDIFLQRN